MREPVNCRCWGTIHEDVQRRSGRAIRSEADAVAEDGMIHASRELIEAMRGEHPPMSYAEPGDESACRTRRYGETLEWAALFFSGKDRWVSGAEQGSFVDCPNCRALTEAARGPERTIALLVHADELREREETGGATLKDREAA